MLGLCGELSRRVGKVDTRVEVLDFRQESVEGSGSRNAMDNNLVPGFILPKPGCCRYGCSDGLLNARTVGFEHREGGGVVFGDKLDVVVCGELYGGNKGFVIAELMALRMERLLVFSVSAVPFLSMTMVRSRLVKTEGVAFLLGGEVVEGVAGAQAAFWADVRVGSCAIGLDGGVVVVAAAGCWLCCCCSCAVRVVI